MSCGIGGLDLVLLWLWCWLTASAPIWSLTWELLYAGVVLKNKAKKKTKKKKKTKMHSSKRGNHRYIRSFDSCKCYVEKILKVMKMSEGDKK